MELGRGRLQLGFANQTAQVELLLLDGPSSPGLPDISRASQTRLVPDLQLLDPEDRFNKVAGTDWEEQTPRIPSSLP